jgi:hypothetical protein
MQYEKHGQPLAAATGATPLLDTKAEEVGIEVRQSSNAPTMFEIYVRTPQGDFVFGDYPAEDEATDLAERLVRSSTDWRDRGEISPWYPFVWQRRQSPRGGPEYWRRGPNGTTLSTWEPHRDGVWRMYWGSLPIVRSHQDRGIFSSHWDAIFAIDGLAAAGMKDALLD